MKLYVKDEKNKKIYINKVASTRTELRNIIGKNNFKVQGHEYNIQDVYAIKDSNDTYKGILVGGTVGVFAGPVGIALGGISGAIIGRGNDLRKRKNVEKFNRSRNRWTKK